MRFGTGYLIFCEASTFCSSHADLNSLAYAAIENPLLPDPAFVTPKKKNLFNQLGVFFLFYDSLFYLVLIVSLGRFISWGLYQKLLCEVCLLSGFNCRWEAN